MRRRMRVPVLLVVLVRLLLIVVVLAYIDQRLLPVLVAIFRRGAREVVAVARPRPVAVTLAVMGRVRRPASGAVAEEADAGRRERGCDKRGGARPHGQRQVCLGIGAVQLEALLDRRLWRRMRVRVRWATTRASPETVWRPAGPTRRRSPRRHATVREACTELGAIQGVAFDVGVHGGRVLAAVVEERCSEDGLSTSARVRV